MLIFLETVNERLSYTFDFIFKERDLDYNFTTDLSNFKAYNGIKFNYSPHILNEVPTINPSPILINEGLEHYTIGKALFFREECLTINGVSDPIASVFYILSRYEEYNSSLKDKHGRHLGKHSVMYRFNWHKKAMSDRWSEDFLSFVLETFGKVYIKKRHLPQLIPTFDIDKAYAYKHKGLLRNLLGYLKDLFKKDNQRVKERQQVLNGSKKDPFDNYDKIYEIHTKGFDVKLFWMLGNYGKYDKNISHRNKRHVRLIRKMNEITSIGIHPSYKSNSNDFFIHSEIERLQTITEKHVRMSRQHYLMLSFPKTYQNLIEQEIEHDYSMGYADIIGFRAGTARTFSWFDLSTNKRTELRIHPFAYMDGTLHEYLKLSTNEAEERIAKLYLETKSYGGSFVFLWHNDTIGDYGHWKDWSKVLEFSLRLNELNE